MLVVLLVGVVAAVLELFHDCGRLVVFRVGRHRDHLGCLVLRMARCLGRGLWPILLLLLLLLLARFCV